MRRAPQTRSHPPRHWPYSRSLLLVVQWLCSYGALFFVFYAFASPIVWRNAFRFRSDLTTWPLKAECCHIGRLLESAVSPCCHTGQLSVLSVHTVRSVRYRRVVRCGNEDSAVVCSSSKIMFRCTLGVAGSSTYGSRLSPATTCLSCDPLRA